MVSVQPSQNKTCCLIHSSQNGEEGESPKTRRCRERKSRQTGVWLAKEKERVSKVEA